MANYPSFPFLLDGSGEEWIDDINADRSVSGGVKVRSFFTAKKRRFTLSHLLNASDRSTLQSFYDTNRILLVTLTWTPDGQTYDVLFDGPPKFDYLTPTLARVTVKLLQQ